MTGMLRDLLNERAEAVGSHDLALNDLIAQGELRVSHRRRLAVIGTAAAVALTVGASLALPQIGDDRTSPPMGPPTTPPSTVDDGPDATGSRPLTYGVGATIHYGDRIIEAAEDADGLFVFDEGLAILTGDDGDASDTHLYFTDGGEPSEIARGIGRVTSGEAGSLLLWQHGDDVVIYDVRTRSVLAQLPLNGRLLTNPITPLEDAVYWHEYTEDTATTEGRDELVRYDVATGARTPASEAEYRAETRTAASPVLVVGSAESRTPAQTLTVDDARLGIGSNEDGTSGPVFVAATGERLRVSVPARYDGRELWVFEWLDDDRFATVASGGVKGAPIGDLLICVVSAGRCRTVAVGEQYWLLPGPGASVGAED